MANEKRGAKARRILAEKENIANIAKWLLVAFCLQFVFYLGLINIVPFNNPETMKMNSLYSEKWINYKGSDGNLHTDGNGIKFIYGYNMVLLVCATGLVLYYAVIFMEEYEGIVVLKAKEFFKEHKGLMFLVLFMLWTFISSCLAYDKFRSFVGCYNLRDGFFSFSFYGSVLVLILLMSLSGFEGKVKSLFNKIEIDPRKLIVDIFLGVMTIIAIVTLLDYKELYYGDNLKKYEIYGTEVYAGDIGLSVEPKQYTYAYTKEGEEMLLTIPSATKTSITSSVFNNSNHYAYVLCIAVIVAAVMFIKTKSLWRIGYLLSYVLLTVMLIINDTFGAYLGIMIALVLMLIHAIITISKEPKQFICVYISLALFTVLSMRIVNPADEIIVKKNFDYISQSISAILGIEKENEVQETEKQIVGVSGEQYIVEEVVKNTESEQKDLSDVAAGDAGSGRWKLWVGAWKIISSNFKHEQKYIENGTEKIVLGDEEYNTYIETKDGKKASKTGKIYIENAKENIIVDAKSIYIPSGEEIVLVTDSKTYIVSGDEKIEIDDKNIEKIGNITINTRFKFDKLGDRIKDSLFGDGLENFIYEYSKIEIGEGRSHNLVLQLAGTVGIPGMLLYVLGVAFIFFKALKYFKVWDTYTYMGMFVMVAYLISSLTGNSGFYTSGYFYIFVGFVVVGTIALSKAKENENQNLHKVQK